MKPWLLVVLLVGCQRASPPAPPAPPVAPRGDSPHHFYPAVVAAVRGQPRVCEAISALRAGKALPSVAPVELETVLVPDRQHTVARRIVALTVATEAQRPTIEQGLIATQNASRASGELLAALAGGRGHTLAGAAATLVVQSVRAVTGREAADADQVALLRLFDAALAPSFASLSEQQRAEAFDGLHLEAGMIGSMRTLAADDARVMGQEALARFCPP